MNNSFENMVKERLHWSLKKWEAAGEEERSFKTLINSMIYWSGRLATAMRNNNVIITLFKNNVKLYPRLEKLVESIHLLNSEISIMGYTKFKNKKYLSVSFENSEVCDYVKKNLKFVDGVNVAFLHWVPEALQDSITVDWLSFDTDLDVTIDFVMQYMDIKSVLREVTTLDNGLKLTSGKVNFKGKFKKEIAIDDIPHCVIIDGLEALIVIQGRQYSCFTCSKLGHRAKECYRAYCYFCKKILNRTHNCFVYNRDVQFREGENVQQLNPLNIKDNSENQMDSYTTDTVNMKEETTRNSFFNKKLVFPESLETQLKFADSAKDCLRNESETFDLGLSPNNTVKKVTDPTTNFFLESFNSFGEEKRNNNQYIKEESYRGDPNFVLVDTSSEESDRDSEEDQFNLEQAIRSMTELQDCAEISRKMVEDSIAIINRKESLKRTAVDEADNQGTTKALNLSAKVSTVNVQEDNCPQAIKQQTLIKARNNKKKKSKIKHK